MARIPRALTIAGSDCGGGAGIQADLKTFTAFKVYGMSALASVTVQNTRGVSDIFDLPPKIVAGQIEAVSGDIGVDAAKTGMLSNAGIIEAVASEIERRKIRRLVVDPVMRAKGGDPLLRPDAQEVLVKRMLPLAFLATPNIPEAEALAGRSIASERDRKEAARRILGLGPRAVLIKGGHFRAAECVDLYYDGKAFKLLKGTRIKTSNTHGTGCTLSAAITASLACGCGLFEAVLRAKEYVGGAIGRSFRLGQGHGPLNHFWNLP